MTKFHTSLSRRSFMKALGLGAAAVGTAAVAAPIFKDLDELAALEDNYSPRKKPWWVKERDFKDPTVDVEWDQITRHDNQYILWVPKGRIYTYGEETYEKFLAEGTANTLKANQDKRAGCLTKDWALDHVSLFHEKEYFKWTLEPADYLTYDGQPGLESLSTSPEENSAMLKTALTFLGAALVGICEMDSDTKKMYNSYHSQGKRIVLDGTADKASINDTEIIVPDKKATYAISVGLGTSKESWRMESVDTTGSGTLRDALTMDRYRRWQFLQRAAQRFINYLGYQCMGYPNFRSHGVLPSGGMAILTGLAESGRNNNVFITPEYGPAVGFFTLITDIPLSPSKPIDAGIFRFCHTCHKCAKSCPTSAIDDSDEPSWDSMDSSLYEYGKGQEIKFCGPGKRHFISDNGRCGSMLMTGVGTCSNCMGTCTFNTNTGAGIHEIVKPTLAVTSIFNRFFYWADEFYGFGLTPDEKKEEWWDKVYPIHGYDTAYTAEDGAYKKTGF